MRHNCWYSYRYEDNWSSASAWGTMDLLRLAMIIRYANGRTIQGVALARTDTTMRVALQGGHDVVQFTNINGRWVSEDCEPVNIGSAAAENSAPEPPSEDAFICAPDLASHLVKLLYQGPEPQEAA